MKVLELIVVCLYQMEDIRVRKNLRKDPLSRQILLLSLNMLYDVLGRKNDCLQGE